MNKAAQALGKFARGIRRKRLSAAELKLLKKFADHFADNALTQFKYAEDIERIMRAKPKKKSLK